MAELEPQGELHMKPFIVVSLAAALVASAAFAGDFELAGMKSKTPDGWKEEKPTRAFSIGQIRLPKAEGDSEDGVLAVFYFNSGSGTVEANLKRQLNTFKPADGKAEPENTVGKIKVGKVEATYQDVKGTYLSKDGGPFDPNAKTTEKPNFRQLYVIFTANDGEYYLKLIGPAKTVGKHKKDFEEFLKNFK
jgi:hypothetical protein